VLKGIEAAQKAGLQVKINMVVKKGMNEDQIIPMARYFKGKDIILRFIEFMDVGNHNEWDENFVVSKRGIIETIHAEMPLEPRSEEHTSELQSRFDLVCRLLLEKKKYIYVARLYNVSR